MVRPALEKTLKTLQLDYVDLYIIELPIAFKVRNDPLHCYKRTVLQRNGIWFEAFCYYLVGYICNQQQFQMHSWSLSVLHNRLIFILVTLQRLRNYLLCGCFSPSQEMSFTQRMRLGSTFMVTQISVPRGKWVNLCWLICLNDADFSCECTVLRFDRFGWWIG